MRDCPVAVLPFDLGVSPVDGITAWNPSEIDIQRRTLRRRSTEDIRPPGYQRERHGPIARVADEHGFRFANRCQCGRTTLVA